MATTAGFAPGDLSRLLNPNLKDADADTVLKSSVSAVKPATADIKPAKVKRSAPTPAAGKSKGPKPADTQVGKVNATTHRALSAAASLLKQKQRQYEIAGKSFSMDTPVMRAVSETTARSDEEADDDDDGSDDGADDVSDDDHDYTDDGWRKNLIDINGDSDSDDDQAGMIRADEKTFRAMDVRDVDVDGDSEAEMEAAEAKRREIAKQKKYKAADDERNPRTVFLGNVPTLATAKDVKAFLAPAGKVESMRFRSVAFAEAGMPKRIAFAKQALHEQRNSMNAYAVMETEAAAQKAAATLNNAVMTITSRKSSAAAAVAAVATTAAAAQGKKAMAAAAAMAAKKAASGASDEGETVTVSHHIRVDVASGSGHVDPYRSVFLGGLAFSANEEQVRAHFERCGAVESVRLVRDKKLNIGKGIGFVTFKNRFSVPEALRLDGKSFMDRKIRVNKVSLSGTSATTGKSTASGQVDKAKRELQQKKLRKDEAVAQRVERRERRLADPDASADDGSGSDEDAADKGPKAKRARAAAASAKVQGAFMKAFASGAMMTGGGKLKKPRHTPRSSSGTIGGVLRPQSWMGQISKQGDTLGRVNKPTKKAGHGGKKGGKR